MHVERRHALWSLLQATAAAGEMDGEKEEARAPSAPANPAAAGSTKGPGSCIGQVRLRVGHTCDRTDREAVTVRVTA